MQNLSISNKKHLIAGKKIKYLNSKLLNMSFGLATINNSIDNIFSLINTSIYLNNASPSSQMNPFGNNNVFIRYGSDLRHSAITT